MSFWINPRVITPFTTGFFGAVNEQHGRGGLSVLDAVAQLPAGELGRQHDAVEWQRPVASTAARACASGANTWTHLAFSVNRGVVSVYINGVRQIQRRHACRTSSAPETGIFALGVNYWDLPFNGLIDELKVYEASLSGAEIKALDIDHLPTAAAAGLGRIAAGSGRRQRRAREPAAAAHRCLCLGDQLGVVESRGAEHDGAR